MKKETGITLVSLVVTIIILIILAGISINLLMGDNGIITKAQQAKENTLLAQEEEAKQLNQLYVDLENLVGSDSENVEASSILKLIEFKKAIAQAIEEAGGVKTQEDATKEIMSENIKGIVNEVTKTATATADNISKGKTAWVNGNMITGTGVDNDASYDSGYKTGNEVVPNMTLTLYTTQNIGQSVTTSLTLSANTIVDVTKYNRLTVNVTAGQYFRINGTTYKNGTGTATIDISGMTGNKTLTVGSSVSSGGVGIDIGRVEAVVTLSK